MSAKKSFLIVPVIVLIFLCDCSLARTIYVPADFGSIQAAVNDSNNGDTIIVADRTYTGNGNRDIDFLGRSITVHSENGPNNCIIDCNGTQTEPHRAFHFHSGEHANSVVDGFTIENGYAAEGGAIFCQASSPTIANCAFSENLASGYEYGGAAICSLDSTPTVTNCTFSRNTTYEGCGGAICNYGNQGNVVVADCTFSENSAYGEDGGYGGAIYNWQADGSLTVANCSFIANTASSSHGGGGGAMCLVSGSTTVANCTFRGNYSDRLGGGLWSIGGEPATRVTNCTFSSNHSGGGGGMCIFDSSPMVTNCAFTGNLAYGERYNSGGAILNWGAGAAATVANCTFSGNAAYDGSGKGYGGGLCCYMQRSDTINCIIYDNMAPDGNEMALLAVGDANVNYLDIKADSVYLGASHTLNWGSGNIDIDPCFVLPGYWDPNGTPEDVNDDFWVVGDYHLLPDSPCIDAGDPNYVAGANDTDLDGKPRVIGRRIDMGAYEFGIPEFEVGLQIRPRTLNAKSRGKFISAVLTLPPHLDALDISDEPLTLYPGEIPSQKCHRSRNKIMCKFDRRQLIAALPDDTEAIEIEVVGQLTNGQYFYGCDFIRVKHRR